MQSGTRLDISYHLDDAMDADLQDEIMGYFREAETDSIDSALEEFGSDVSEEDLRLVRLRFMSEVAN